MKILIALLLTLVLSPIASMQYAYAQTGSGSMNITESPGDQGTKLVLRYVVNNGSGVGTADFRCEVTDSKGNVYRAQKASTPWTSRSAQATYVFPDDFLPNSRIGGFRQGEHFNIECYWYHDNDKIAKTEPGEGSYTIISPESPSNAADYSAPEKVTPPPSTMPPAPSSVPEQNNNVPSSSSHDSDVLGVPAWLFMIGAIIVIFILVGMVKENGKKAQLKYQTDQIVQKIEEDNEKLRLNSIELAKLGVFLPPKTAPNPAGRGADLVSCPNCNSHSITAIKKGFSPTRTAVGTGLGLLGGGPLGAAIGTLTWAMLDPHRNEIELVCLNCKHKF